MYTENLLVLKIDTPTPFLIMTKEIDLKFYKNLDHYYKIDNNVISNLHSK